MPEITRQVSSAVSGSGTVEAGPGKRLEHHDPYGLCGRVVDDRYHVERVVDQGGFGVIYRAHHLLFDSPVALKVLRTEGARADSADFQRRFMLEGKLLFGLSSLHPSIVRVYEMGTLEPSANSAPYLALEWLEGVSLAEELRERTRRGAAPYAVDEALDLLEGVSRALSLAHARRIAHRDIKPGNIFLARQGKRIAPKILDFGLAKVMADLATSAELYAESMSLERSFTPAYAAPEQWLKRLGATGTWSDVFSLALVFVELIVGRRPLAGDDTTQLLAACIDPNLRPTPRSLGAQVSDELEQVFARALAVHPRERYRDVGELWRALCSATGRPEQSAADAALDVLAQAPSALDELGLEPTADLPAHEKLQPVPMPTANTAHAVTRSRRVSVRWALLLLAVAVGLGALALRKTTRTQHVAPLVAEPAKKAAVPPRAPAPAEAALAPPVMAVPTTLPSSVPSAELPREHAPARATRASAPRRQKPAPEAAPPSPQPSSAAPLNLPAKSPARFELPPAPPTPAAAPRTAEDLVNDHELMLRR